MSNCIELSLSPNPFKILKPPLYFAYNFGLAYGPTRSLMFDISQTYNIIVHPNPVTENVTISTSDASMMSEVLIYSNEGKMVQSFTQVNSGTVINMNNYASGFYMIKIKDKNGEMQVIKLSKK